MESSPWTGRHGDQEQGEGGGALFRVDVRYRRDSPGWFGLLERQDGEKWEVRPEMGQRSTRPSGEQGGGRCSPPLRSPILQTASRYNSLLDLWWDWFNGLIVQRRFLSPFRPFVTTLKQNCLRNRTKVWRRGSFPPPRIFDGGCNIRQEPLWAVQVDEFQLCSFPAWLSLWAASPTQSNTSSMLLN